MTIRMPEGNANLMGNDINSSIGCGQAAGVRDGDASLEQKVLEEDFTVLCKHEQNVNMICAFVGGNENLCPHLGLKVLTKGYVEAFNETIKNACPNGPFQKELWTAPDIDKFSSK